MQLPLFEPKTTWAPPLMSNLPSWEGVKRIGLDTETCDPHLRKMGIGVRRGGFVAGISFAIEDGPSFYLPIRHEGGDNLPVAQVLQYLSDQLKVFRGEIVGANLQYDLDYLMSENLDFSNVKRFRDIQIADPLINELHDSYSMANIALRHNLPGKSEEKLREAAAAFGVDPKGGMWRLPGRFVGEYAEQDAVLPLQILRKQERLIDEADLWDIYNLESDVLPVLVKMRRRGVLIDQDKLAQIEEWSLKEEAQALGVVKRDTGYDIGVGNVWKADAIAPALEAAGLQLGKTSQGKPQIDKDVLDSFDHPVSKAVAWARKVNKLRTTFAASVREHMQNGRIHCTFNQIARETEAGDMRGARYGRLSCILPNLQQQPSRDEFAAMWRSIYIAEPGAIWACNDYSQQEPRWTTHFAALMGLPKARQAAQQYWDDPLLDNHTFMAELTGLPRKFAKCIYLGLCYGEGGAKLCDDLKLPTRWAMSYEDDNGKRRVEHFATQDQAQRRSGEIPGNTFVWRAAGEEGQAIIDKFDQRAPFIRKLAKKAKQRVEKVGQIRTVGGRVLHFPVNKYGETDWTHKALNRLIQGSSADQTKAALVAIEREMPEAFIQLQVHDEIDGSFASVAEAKRVAELMKTCIPDTKVPFRVDVEVGPNWGEIKEAA